MARKRVADVLVDTFVAAGVERIYGVPGDSLNGITDSIRPRKDLQGIINVEVIGGSLMVQHYVEEIGEPTHLKLVSNSDVFTPTGRTKIGVIWHLSVTKIDHKTCEFTNIVHSSATPELLDFLGKQGIPWEVFQAARKPISEAHNRQETPLLAKSIERHALRKS